MMVSSIALVLHFRHYVDFGNQPLFLGSLAALGPCYVFRGVFERLKTFKGSRLQVLGGFGGIAASFFLVLCLIRMGSVKSTPSFDAYFVASWTLWGLAAWAFRNLANEEPIDPRETKKPYIQWR